MLNRFLIISAVLTTLWCGCSKKEASPLSVAQDQHFRDTIANIALFNSALSSGTNTSVSGDVTPFSTLGFVHTNNLPTDWLGLSSEGDRQSNKKQISEILKAAVTKGDCKVSSPAYAKGSSTAAKSAANFWNIPTQRIDYSVTGANCPATASGFISINADQASGHFTVSAHVEYAFVTAEMRALSDVDRVNSDFSLTLDTKPQGDASTVTGNSSFHGTVHSQTDGNLTLYFDAHGAGVLKAASDSFGSGAGEIKIGIEFPDFVAEVRMVGKQEVGTSKISAQYFVNTVERSESDMKPYTRALDTY